MLLRAVVDGIVIVVVADFLVVDVVIVVDDASTDGTAYAAERSANSFDNVRVVSLPSHGGPSIARNHGLSTTDAAWFLPIDSDDIVEAERLSSLYYIAKQSNAHLVADNLFLSNEADPTNVTRVLWPGKPEGQIALSPEIFISRCFDVEIPRSELGFIKPLIDRRFVHSAQQPYVPELRFGEDYELYARMLLDGA